MSTATESLRRTVPTSAARPGEPIGNVVLRLDVVANSRVLVRITSIMALRQVEVITMDVSAVVDGQRRVTVEVGAADETKLTHVVKFLNRSPDVLKVVQLSDDMSHTRRSAFVKVAAATDQLAQVIGIAQGLRADVVDVDEAGCTLFIASEPTRVTALLSALGDFRIVEVISGPPLRTRGTAHRRADLRSLVGGRA